MSDSRVEFRRFHHLRFAVPDFDAAVADWTTVLGWQPASSSSELVTFALDDAYIELVPANGSATGIVNAAVVVDDVDAVAAQVAALGVNVTKNSDGSVSVDPAAVTGVPLELRAEDGGPADNAGPYRRINHVVVAVADADAGKDTWAAIFGAWPSHSLEPGEVSHHLPVGIAWFGLTSTGTDTGALSKFVERRGEGIYAVGLVVDDRLETLAALEQRGARVISTPAAGQTFLHPATTHGLLIDLMAEGHPSRLG